MLLPSLTDLSSSALVSSIANLRAQQRIDEVQFLWLLAEIEDRKTYAELGYGSLWDYCQVELRLTNGAAGRRITAARLLKQFPAAADYLADGRIGLTTLGKLKSVIDADNHKDLLDKASFKNEYEVEELVRTLAPLTFVRDTVIRTIQPAPAVVRANATPASTAAAACAQVTMPTSPAPSHLAVAPVAMEVRPIDGEYVSLTMRVPKEFMRDLEQLTAAMSHIVPSGKPREVLREAMRRTLADLEKKKGGLPARRAEEVISRASLNGPTRESATPGPVVNPANDPVSVSNSATRESPTPSDARAIPMKLQRDVWARDGGRCTFVGASGRRCGSNWMLEIHHRHAASLGGGATLENLTLHCRQHNLLEAQRDFGADFMARFTKSH